VKGAAFTACEDMVDCFPGTDNVAGWKEGESTFKDFFRKLLAEKSQQKAFEYVFPTVSLGPTLASSPPALLPQKFVGGQSSPL
jgi:hypothetical protein